jgi:ppGpp synthetase/RelA/SpoT-type nucleotidyltranferase
MRYQQCGEIINKKKYVILLFLTPVGSFCRKNLSLDQIHDLHGVRLILETKGDCYVALDIINELWPRVIKFKDYIRNPKPNG